MATCRWPRAAWLRRCASRRQQAAQVDNLDGGLLLPAHKSKHAWLLPFPASAEAQNPVCGAWQGRRRGLCDFPGGSDRVRISIHRRLHCSWLAPCSKEEARRLHFLGSNHAVRVVRVCPPVALYACMLAFSCTFERFLCPVLSSSAQRPSSCVLTGLVQECGADGAEGSGVAHADVCRAQPLPAARWPLAVW